MRLFLSVAILLISLADAPAQSTSVSQTTPAPTPLPSARQRALSTGERRGLDQLREARRLLDAQRHALEAQAQQTVLVVPSPDLKPESLAAITEDLTVMCRIFDRALATGARSVSTFAYGGRVDTLQRLLLPHTQPTQALYLDGYGAVFFIPVDFPLMPPAQEKPQAQPQEAGDQVWSQTVKELHGQQDGTDDEDQAGPTYDAQKIEDLKTALIKTLRHAANIRTPRAQDYIVLAVGTQASGYNYIIGQKSDTYSLRFLPSTDARRSATNAADLAPDPAATLILRAVKADLDALAAGQLTIEQLTAKVETFWSSSPRDVQQPAQPTASSPR